MRPAKVQRRDPREALLALPRAPELAANPADLRRKLLLAALALPENGDNAGMGRGVRRAPAKLRQARHHRGGPLLGAQDPAEIPGGDLRDLLLHERFEGSKQAVDRSAERFHLQATARLPRSVVASRFVSISAQASRISRTSRSTSITGSTRFRMFASKRRCMW